MTVLSVLLWLLAVAMSVPVAVFVLQCAVAVLGRARPPFSGAGVERPRVAVLVPAHNEEAGIAQTLMPLAAELQEADRLLVVADNCEDATAQIARQCGAEVVERFDDAHRGKGYALALGVEQLRADPPQVVIVMDADCRVDPGSITRLAQRVAMQGLPQQALYLLDVPASNDVRSMLSQLAFVVKNHVRLTGAQRMGMPAPLQGTGMALPWEAVERVSLASGHLAEDMKLGIDLAVIGLPAGFCPEAKVLSPMTANASAARAQRTRWEQGHLATIVHQGPRLLREAAVQRRPRLLLLAADLCVPPLAFLAMGWMLALIAAGVWALTSGDSGPAWLLMASGVGLHLAVLGAWWRYGRARVPGRALLGVPFYVLWKVPIYVGFFFRRQNQWVRTARDAEAQGRS